MKDLAQLRKTIISDGRLSVKDVHLLRQAMFDDEGMTREKGDFLFKLKDTISQEHLIAEFKDLFVEAITTLLLEDEVSPGEIDPEEAKWLRAKIQTKGYTDKLDILILNSLKNKSINYPEILHFKGKTARKFEGFLFYSRYLTIFAVIGSLLSAIARDRNQCRRHHLSYELALQAL